MALAGVGLAIWQTSRVLIPQVTTPTILLQPSMAQWRAEIDASPADYFGLVATSVKDLLRYQGVAVSLARKVARETDVDLRMVLEQQLRRVEGHAARAAACVRWLLASAHLWRIQADLRRARQATFVGAVLVVVGAVAFLYRCRRARLRPCAHAPGRRRADGASGAVGAPRGVEHAPAG